MAGKHDKIWQNIENGELLLDEEALINTANSIINVQQQIESKVYEKYFKQERELSYEAEIAIE